MAQPQVGLEHWSSTIFACPRHTLDWIIGATTVFTMPQSHRGLEHWKNNHSCMPQFHLGLEHPKKIILQCPSPTLDWSIERTTSFVCPSPTLDWRTRNHHSQKPQSHLGLEHKNNHIFCNAPGSSWTGTLKTLSFFDAPVPPWSRALENHNFACPSPNLDSTTCKNCHCYNAPV